LHALDLNNTINQMYQQKKYRQMLIYIEACKAGSMFNDILSPSVNVLAVTASDPTHSSYAIYYDSTRGTYLGDVFSVFWMQDSEKESLTETVQHQFDVVKEMTNTSAVCNYGDMSINNELLKVFQAPAGKVQSDESQVLPRGEVMDSRDIHIAVLRHKLDEATPAERPRVAALLTEAMRRRAKADERIQRISAAAASFVGSTIDFTLPRVGLSADICHINESVKDPVCLKQMIETYKKLCGALDDYSLKHVRVLNSMCSAGLTPSDLAGPMASVCMA